MTGKKQKSRSRATSSKKASTEKRTQVRVASSARNERLGTMTLQQAEEITLPEDVKVVREARESKIAADIKRCPSCGSSEVIYDNEKGEMVCNSCGLIIEENVVDTGPEWRAFDADQRNSRARTGAPIKYMKPNKGLVTEIDMYNRDIRGARLPSKRQAQLYRMRKWHKRASIASSSERNYLIALPELNRVASYLGLPDNIRESAALLYRQCVKNNLIRGRPMRLW